MTQWVEGATPEVDAASRWRPIVAVCVSFTATMIAVVSMRFWIRRHQFYLEDGIIGVTAVFSVMFNIGTIIQTRFGLGLALKARPVSVFHDFIVWNYAIRPFYLWGIAGFKLALCLSYLRMTHGTTDKGYRIFICAVAIFSVLSQTIFVFINLFSCAPLAKIFEPDLHGYCLPYGPVNYTISAVTIVSDVVIFFTPIPLINKLKLDRAVKLGLIFIFSLGLFTTLCSILRMTQIWRIAYGDGNSSKLVLYSALELNVGIITSCLPVLRPLLKHLPRKLLSLLLSTTRGRTADSDNNSNTFAMDSKNKSDSNHAGKAFEAGNRKASIAHRMFSANGIERITTTLGGDSDENILEPGRPDQSGQSWQGLNVMRTVELDVESAKSTDEVRRAANGRAWGTFPFRP